MQTVCRPVVSASTIHPSVCVSMSGKLHCSVSRQNALGYKQHCDCRPTTPVDFRYSNSFPFSLQTSIYVFLFFVCFHFIRKLKIYLKEKRFNSNSVTKLSCDPFINDKFSRNQRFVCEIIAKSKLKTKCIFLLISFIGRVGEPVMV